METSSGWIRKPILMQPLHLSPVIHGSFLGSMQSSRETVSDAEETEHGNFEFGFEACSHG